MDYSKDFYPPLFPNVPSRCVGTEAATPQQPAAEQPGELTIHPAPQAAAPQAGASQARSLPLTQSKFESMPPEPLGPLAAMLGFRDAVQTLGTTSSRMQSNVLLPEYRGAVDPLHDEVARLRQNTGLSRALPEQLAELEAAEFALKDSTAFLSGLQVRADRLKVEWGEFITATRSTGFVDTGDLEELLYDTAELLVNCARKDEAAQWLSDWKHLAPDTPKFNACYEKVMLLGAGNFDEKFAALAAPKSTFALQARTIYFTYAFGEPHPYLRLKERFQNDIGTSGAKESKHLARCIPELIRQKSVALQRFRETPPGSRGTQLERVQLDIEDTIRTLDRLREQRAHGVSSVFGTLHNNQMGVVLNNLQQAENRMLAQLRVEANDWGGLRTLDHRLQELTETKKKLDVDLSSELSALAMLADLFSVDSLRDLFLKAIPHEIYKFEVHCAMDPDNPPLDLLKEILLKERDFSVLRRIKEWCHLPPEVADGPWQQVLWRIGLHRTQRDAISIAKPLPADVYPPDASSPSTSPPA